MLCLLPLAALLSAACQTISKPVKPNPQYIYMVLYGGKFRGYPGAKSGLKEIEVSTDKMAGSMCFKPDDWLEHTDYLFELEAAQEQ